MDYASVSPPSFKSKLSKYFWAHGRFCASHPWEVIVSIVTLTVCALSMSVLSGGKVSTVCGFEKPCVPKPVDEERADTVMLSVVNCLAVVYIYNQFSSLRKAGSKYLLGIAGLFTIFSSFVFGSTVVNIIDNKVSGLNEALPFFLLLIDLSKATSLAKTAFKSRNKEEVRDNIGKGIASLGPTMTLDTLVEVLLISIGTISGVPRFETMCCFGCMSIVANYLVFMTFFPASLALVLEVCPHDPNNSGWHLDNLARDMQEEETKKHNPVAQRVKVIMSLGLAVVHLHSRFLSTVTGWSFGFGLSAEKGGVLSDGKTVLTGDEMEMVPLPQYLWWKAFNFSADQLIAILLSTLLFVKYIFFDKSEPFSSSSVPPTPSRRTSPSSHQSVPPSPQDKPAPQQTPTCPFALSATSESSLATQRPSPISIHQVLSTDSAPLPQGMEQLLRNGLVVESSAMERPALLPAASSREESAFGGITKNRSSAQLQELLSSTEDSIVHADLALDPMKYVSVGTQTDPDNPDVATPMFTVGKEEREGSASPDPNPSSLPRLTDELPQVPRQLEECLAILKSDEGAKLLSDIEIMNLVAKKYIPAYKLETVVGDYERGVSIRRQILTKQLTASQGLLNLPFTNYPHYTLVNGACCENVIGYMPIPVGYAGPLVLDGTPYHVPMSTTEGALVASTNRGCRAVASAGGIHSAVLDDGMTRGPVVKLPSATQASEVKLWLDNATNFELVAEVFNSTSRFARLKKLQTGLAGRLLYIRFKASTGDAMGMNMLSKGVEKALGFVREKFPLLEIISLSGNFCTDKKPAAINWVDGRGKSVVCEATIPAQIVTKVLKTTVEALLELNISKNLVGSAMAGSVGGFNAHAANIVTAIFIATGQDPAQNIASSNCITLMERSGIKGEDLLISCTMPSIEIGTVGGGTILPPQAACLEMLGVRGPNQENPGQNASRLARIVCGTVLAGELSLLSALAAGHLVKSHLTHNRSQLNLSSIAEGSESRDHRRTNSSTGIPSSSSHPFPIRRASCVPGT